MRKILIFVTVAAMFWACKKDNTTINQNTDSPLLGKWHLVSDTLVIYKNGVVVDHEYNAHTNGGAGDLQFNADGSFKFSNNHQYNGPLSWSLTGDQLTFNVPSYTVGEATAPAYINIATVKLITKNEMVLFFKTNIETSGSTSLQHFNKVE